MPFTAPPLASYEYCFRRLVKFLGIAAPNDPTGDTIISTAPYTADMIKKQICQSDYEVQALIASVENQTYRPTYFTELPVVVPHGEKINGYIGIHGGVKVRRTRTFTSNVTLEIGIGSYPITIIGANFTADDVGSLLTILDGVTPILTDEPILTVESALVCTVSGTNNTSTPISGATVTITAPDEESRLASSFDALMRAREHFAFYGSPSDLYYIENGTAYTADPYGNLLVNLPQLVPANPLSNPPVLSSPQVYQNGVVGHAIATLLPVGADAGHRQNWSSIWANYAQLIIGNSASLPDPERMQRIST